MVLFSRGGVRCCAWRYVLVTTSKPFQVERELGCTVESMKQIHQRWKFGPRYLRLPCHVFLTHAPYNLWRGSSRQPLGKGGAECPFSRKPNHGRMFSPAASLIGPFQKRPSLRLSRGCESYRRESRASTAGEKKLVENPPTEISPRFFLPTVQHPPRPISDSCIRCGSPEYRHMARFWVPTLQGTWRAVTGGSLSSRWVNRVQPDRSHASQKQAKGTVQTPKDLKGT